MIKSNQDVFPGWFEALIAHQTCVHFRVDYRVVDIIFKIFAVNKIIKQFSEVVKNELRIMIICGFQSF